LVGGNDEAAEEENTMAQQLPAVSLVAVPGRRRATLEAAREIERRGFAAIYAPSVFSNMSLCEALCHVTDRISFATATSPTAAVINAFNGGSLLTNYIGHGSNEIWSDFIFTSATAAALWAKSPTVRA